jgi:hypothetical protein
MGKLCFCVELENPMRKGLLFGAILLVLLGADDRDLLRSSGEVELREQSVDNASRSDEPGFVGGEQVASSELLGVEQVLCSGVKGRETGASLWGQCESGQVLRSGDNVTLGGRADPGAMRLWAGDFG